MDPKLVLALVGDLGAIGFVLWLAHRLTAVTIPAMTEAFAAAAERQRSDFRETLEKQRSDFTAFHKQEHEAHEVRLQRVMDKCLGTREP